MKRFKKSGLTDGASSEWSESEHPRDEGGKFCEKEDADGFEKSDNLSAAANSEGLTSEPNSGTIISRKLRSAYKVYKPIAMKTATATEFHGAIADAKEANPHGAFVDVHTEGQYGKMKTYTSNDGSCGIAVEESGNIVSVFSNGKHRGALQTLLPLAIENGGDRLDCYSMDGGGLCAMYAKSGFYPVARVKFNREYALEDWNYKEHGEPNIIFMAHCGDSAEEVVKKYGTYPVSDIGNVPMFADYDKARQYRDNEMKRRWK